ncbi:uncharacterized protein [Nicotiana tomentosiformis]|uniref:uncharacterized protein n=1 Tax=Nicotiana tomentosiformis TaxID=4098 RepID=UPI00388CE299
MELRQTISALECRLTEALSTIDAMKAKIELLEEHVNVGVTEANMENFLCHLENYFRHDKVKDDEAKINTIVLYLSDIAALWWRRKCVDMEKGLCKIETWEQFKKLKKQLYPVNVVYEARQKLRELRQTATIREYVREFTTLMLQISSLSKEDSLFYFMDGLQN